MFAPGSATVPVLIHRSALSVWPSPKGVH